MIPEVATDDLMPLLIEIRNLSSDKYEAVAQYVRDAYKAVLPAGKIIASNVSLEDFMEYYAVDRTEWVEGYIIKMSPGTLKHNGLMGGVPEYWIIDPLRKESRFYRRDETGRYIRQIEDPSGNYFTSALPKLMLHVPTLWQDDLPGPIAVANAVKGMLENAS